jgi:acyl-coenzyme A synthetase/AMP-(fatty) acid ligase
MGIFWDFESFGDSPALIADTGVTMTYRELASLSGNTKAEIREAAGRNSTCGTLVMFICRNTPGAIAGYAALINEGCTMLPCSAELPQETRRELMNTYRPGFLLLPDEMRDEYPTMKEVCGIRDYILLKTNYADVFPIHPQLSLLITTSGSTGSAKFVRQSRDNLRFNAAAIAECLQIGPSDKTITALPLQYTYGLSVLHANLMRGAAMVVTRSGVMDNEFWDLFENEEVTCFHGIPNTYEMLRHIELFEDDFPSLRTMSQAGGKLSRELQEYYGRYAEKNGKRFIIMYGQSEATAAISRLPQRDTLRKPGSVGKVIPSGAVSLIDEAGNPVTEAHKPGEVIYRGPNVAMGYAQRGEDLQLGDEWNGVLRTGDIAEFDGDGYLYITGRLKRFIKAAGHRISLDEIDSMIMDELNIHSVSVGKDEHLTVFVTDGRKKDLIAAFLPRRISAVRACLRVLTVPEFPKNEAGKILYAKLQAAAEN